MAVQWLNIPKDVPVESGSIWCLGEKEQALRAGTVGCGCQGHRYGQQRSNFSRGRTQRNERRGMKYVHAWTQWSVPLTPSKHCIAKQPLSCQVNVCRGWSSRRGYYGGWSSHRAFLQGWNSHGAVEATGQGRSQGSGGKRLPGLIPCLVAPALSPQG